ncbi:MAG: 1-acyl-sn-glycerol-3-phosphate acyltransferase [Candidatus Parcubacteria bacterium]|nr:1-acyl-sn-glycerol-3-phosphate acyltransferase [Burkholderiales bacterium]
MPAPPSAPSWRLLLSISVKRLARVALHLAQACVFSSRAGHSAEYRQRWSRQLLAILGIRLRAGRLGVAPGTLLVANHVSWLDVVALSALCPANFVAKRELRRWPLIGWLLERHGCLFLDRRVGRHLLSLNAQITAQLAAGEVIAVFPEGTTTNGASLLPFRRALFEPVARGGHRVQPFVLSYADAAARRSEAAAFIGEQSLWASLVAIASLPELTISVVRCPSFAGTGLTRREIARRAQGAIQQRLRESGPLGSSALCDTTTSSLRADKVARNLQLDSHYRADKEGKHASFEKSAGHVRPVVHICRTGGRADRTR